MKPTIRIAIFSFFFFIAGLIVGQVLPQSAFAFKNAAFSLISPSISTHSITHDVYTANIAINPIAAASINASIYPIRHEAIEGQIRDIRNPNINTSSIGIYTIQA